MGVLIAGAAFPATVVKQGEFDDVPEQAFVAVGGIDDMLARAERLEG